jgi:hypothetical protein
MMLEVIILHLEIDLSEKVIKTHNFIQTVRSHGLTFQTSTQFDNPIN